MRLFSKVAGCATALIFYLNTTVAIADYHGGSVDPQDGNTSWILFYIGVSENADRLERLGEYNSMIECFEAWSVVDAKLPKPKLNYQIICINTKQMIADIPPTEDILP